MNEFLREYHHRTPIRNSVVRLDLEQELFDDLNSAQNILIRGYTMIGKTSMLWCLERRFNEKHANYGFSSMIGIRNFYEFRERLCSDLYKETLFTLSINDPLADFAKQMPCAFLALDELTESIWRIEGSEDILNYLIESSKNLDLKIAFMIHKTYVVDPYAQILKERADLKEVFIPPITKEEARIMITTPLKDTVYSFSDDAIEYLYELSGGRPSEINYFCDRLLSKSCLLKDKGKKHFTRQDIQELFGEMNFVSKSF